jgi:hypothetical protein
VRDTFFYVVLSVASLTLINNRLHAANNVFLSLGGAALSEGDDRLRAGLSVMGQTMNWGSRVSYFTRSFGPVHEELVLATAFREVSLITSPQIGARVGLTGMIKRLSLTYLHPQDQFRNTREQRFNLGYHLGTFWRVNWDKTFVELAWGANIYPAGASGGLFLATGAHQLLCASMGVHL